MKSVVLWSLFMTICLLSKVQGTCKNFNGKDLSVGTHHIDCTTVTCHPDGNISQLPCPMYRCQEDKQIGYRQKDLSKPYPQCCEGPICAE